MPQRCALYLRVSTEQQVDGNSLPTQTSLLLRHARARGYAVADIYVDAGLSGKDTNRPELQRLIADARHQHFDVVLVWKVDRISRSMKDLLDLVEMFREHGVAFAEVDQQFDTSTPMGSLALSIKGGFAQFERQTLIERTREGQLQRVLRQEWSCGPAPLGYRKENGRLVEVPEQAALVRRIFEMFLAVRSLRGVALGLNKEGVCTRKGRAWTGNAVGQILRNPVYTGANVYGRHKHGDTRLRAEGDWTVVKGMRKPLVEPEVSTAVRSLLKRGGAERSGPEPRRTYQLSGLARCGKCGSAMVGSLLRRGEKVYRYYRCNGNQHSGRSRCAGTTVSADLLERLVMEKVRGLAKDAPAAQAVAAAVGEGDTEERKEIRRALDRLRARVARLFDLYELGQIDRGLFQERMSRLSAERDRLTAALKAGVSMEQTAPPVGGREETGATNGIVKVVVQDRLAQVHMVGGVVSDISLIPDGDTTTFGGRLRMWRLKAGLLQKDVAQALDVDVCSVRNWEMGRCAPRKRVQEQISLRMQSYRQSA